MRKLLKGKRGWKEVDWDSWIDTLIDGRWGMARARWLNGKRERERERERVRERERER